MAKKIKKKDSFVKKFILIILFGGIIFAGFKAFQLYNGIKEPNVNLGSDKPAYIYIPTGSDYKDVINILYSNNLIINRASFEWVAEKKMYTTNIKPGKYKITNGMSNNSLINLLRSGKQESERLAEVSPPNVPLLPSVVITTSDPPKVTLLYSS